MRKTLLILFLITTTISFAQLPKNLLIPSKENYTYDEYDGSIYMKSRFKESSVIDEKSSSYDAKLKYNILDDAIMHSSNSGIYELAKTPTIHARIDGDYFYYCNFKNQRGLNRDGYYILIELTDQYRIYKRLTLDITDPEEKGPVSSGITAPGNVKTITTYYIEESGIIMELPMNKKGLLATFSDKQNELKEYIKKGKIRVRKEDDLIRLVARYNALKSDETSQNRSLLSTADGNR
ncbi:hypothetical protein D1816_12710 [Aquimarina sp. AD10]|uniref:Uncharacterized protein n=1 Tax=Aquimarina aggregata TaxID=1642818 RepID=A0A162YPC5_9FLAO|nr:MULTISPECIES: hypothetical protein [Aquimarina]AXT61171.1 hypothetical protein D1816_12710 [Aquimarina sp. AD10]KZS39266.1 hypothetical protein AWE51_12000 [Aquimarina aggregata]RKN02213.1 hypothetical protein D7033_01900 [Aquimarina sp. AD10]